MSKVENQPKKLVLIDGSSYLFRAYHALPPLTTTTGIPTGAIYGVVNMLRKLLKDERPDLIAVVFDTKSKNFRHELYAQYKANRPEMAQELAVQIEPLHEIIRAMGIPLIAIEGVEADDVLATLAEKATQNHIRTIISTGDKDLAQLVDKNVTLINTMTGSVLDEKSVVTKFGIGAHQIVDYLTLIGDPVDNVPGVPKVGPKTAVKWLLEYNTIERLIDNANEIKGKVGENLRAHLNELPLCKALVTVRRDISISIVPEMLLQSPADTEKLKELYQRLEFKNWLREITEEAPSGSGLKDSQKRGSYELITDKSAFLSLLQKISKNKLVAMDIRAVESGVMQSKLVGISFSLEAGQASYVPVEHDYPNVATQLSREWVLEKLKPILEDASIGKIGANIKNDMHILANYNIKLDNIIDDTMLAAYVLNSIATRQDINLISEVYLQYKPLSYEEICGKGVKQIKFDKVDLQSAMLYSAENADLNFRLSRVFSEKFKEEPRLLSIYQDIEIPLLSVLCQMEEQGIRIDAEKLKKQSLEIGRELTILEEQATLLAGENFNLSSPKQLQQVLYDKMGLPILERTPTGAPSTGESVLQELSIDYELPKIILKHRNLSKIKTTYADKLPHQINPQSHRVHTCYHQAITATGRLSSTDPNLQNIPIKNEEGRKIRQAFIPDEGYLLLSADYSQIELRIMSHLSQDERLIKAFCDGEDIHRFTASEIFRVPLDKVTTEQRRGAKVINFGLIYGMSAFGVAKQLDIDRSEAQAYMEQYFKRYPGVKIYMDKTREQAAEVGFVETLFGRRLYLPDIRSKNIPRRRAAERTAINAPMQGTAADIIKKAMIALHAKLKNNADIKMLLQVHDELVFEVRPSIMTQAKEMILDCMQNSVKLLVPLEVSLGVGNNWDEAH